MNVVLYVMLLFFVEIGEPAKDTFHVRIVGVFCGFRQGRKMVEISMYYRIGRLAHCPSEEPNAESDPALIAADLEPEPADSNTARL